MTTSTRLMSHTNGTRQYSPHGTDPDADGRSARGTALPPPLATWMNDPRRNCRNKPTIWWYAPEDDEWGTKISTQADADEAKRLCGTCPLDLDCTEYGLRNERHGRWGRVKLPMNATNRSIELAAVARERKRRIA